jgi:transcriptional regulator with XRE-family HTH domain
MLTGDRVDNIPGLAGIGPKKAEKILQGCTDYESMQTAVWKAYQDKGHDYDYFVEQGRLLWLLTSPDDIWQPDVNIPKQQQERSVEYFKELTGDIAAAVPKELDEIGIRIKNIREEKGLSLDELSKLTGFEVELLSNMEQNKIQPQLGTVIKLSKALDSAFGRIVSGVGDKLYSVTRKNERTKISRSTSPFATSDRRSKPPMRSEF